MPTSTSPARRNRKLFEFARGTGLTIPQSLPELSGGRIKVSFLPLLTAHRGQLLSGEGKGFAVHAASFLRTREIFLEEQLLKMPGRFGRIFAHEVFHFVWLRIGNTKRLAYESLLQAEFERGARGELGYSAESLKEALISGEREGRTEKWRHYACESFCDTAGWAFGGKARYAEMTLAKRFRTARMRWFAEQMLGQPLPI